jgi:Uma2 family endonuclease
MSLATKYRPYYTYNDYCQWEGRWELIDGMPYAMSPLPVPQHQRVCLKLSILLEDALTNCADCIVYPPLDWKITDDTIVQPDVIIVCSKIEKKYLDFPPLLVTEVLSPATASKDRGVKMELYQSQKVKYYLIVDPQFKKIEIYTLEKENYGAPVVNAESFNFIFQEDCSAVADFATAWD